MMSPSRDLSANGKPQRNFLRPDTAFSLLILLACAAGAGQFVTSDFTGATDSSNVLIFGSNVQIAPRETLYIALLVDEKLTENAVDSSYSAEVAISVGDTFCFFWGEWYNSYHRVYSRKIILTQFGATKLTQEINYNIAPRKLEYLHAARGTSQNKLVSTFYYNPSLYVSTGTDSVDFASWKDNSLCHVANDTFCIVYKESNVNLAMRKILYSGSTISDIGNSALLSHVWVDGSKNFSNTSVAADSSGNVFVMITRGGTINPKYLEYLLTNTSYDNNGNALVVNNISLNAAGSIQYADAPVVSYADKKFAAVYWTSAGIYLYDVTVSGAPPAVTSEAKPQIVAGNTFRAPTVATNGKKLLVVWKNLATQKIEGKLYPINNGIITMAPQPATKVYSSSVVGDHGPELNVVINDADNIALAWKQNDSAVGCIWGARGVMFPAGEFTSAVELVTVITGDSLVYLPGALDTTLNGGTAACFLQVGPTAIPGAGWSAWLPLADSAALDLATKGDAEYFRFKGSFTRNPVDTIKTPVFRETTVRWNLKPRIITLDSVLVNGTVATGFTGFNDTVDIISHTDIMDCYFIAHDGDASDSSFIEVPWKMQPELAKDTVTGTVDRIARIRLMPDAVWDTVYTHSFFISDDHQWSGGGQSFIVRARKAAPVITAVTFDGETIPDNGTASIVIGKPTTVQITIERPQIAVWNPITYQFKTLNFDTSFTTSSQLIFPPANDDMMMWAIATDAFGISDTSRLLFNYPKYETDSILNPGYLLAKKKLGDSLSFILHSDAPDTITLPALNTGNDTLTIDSVFFTGSSLAWLRFGIMQGGVYVFFDSLVSGAGITPVIIKADSTAPLMFILDTANLSGDSVVYDTFFIYLNDPLYRVDTIPIKLEFNDLPVLSGFSIEYPAGTPYWKTLQRKAVHERGYVFPPHAKIELTFSEPMDSASGAGKTFAHSVFDVDSAGNIDTIPYTQVWSNNYMTLQLRPTYTVASTYFNGLLPIPKTYIPTDSIIVTILSDFTDLATTPASPNYLDVNNDFVNDSGADTTLTFRIDPINFTLDSVSHDKLNTGVSATDSIVLFFSSPIYPGTVDDSLMVNNRSLMITTRYNSYIDSLKQVVFDTVYIENNRAVFKPARRFFYGDSVYCYYRGVCARDSLGYSIDMNKDGIPIGFFDSASTEDDKFWSFHVKQIFSNAVVPDSAATGVSLTTPITMTFSAPLFPGTIDTALTGNRSLQVTSRYSEGTPIDFDSITVGTNRVIFYLNRSLFYADSVFCNFTGLIAKDTNVFSVDLGSDTIYSNNMGRSWFFKVKELSLETVSPDSASSKASIHAPVVMTFSGPVSPDIFDTTIEADSNRSFFMTTRYSGGARLPIKRITFSVDRTTVSVYLLKAYFSYDSLYCDFAGFVKDYSYVSTTSLIPTDTSTVISSYSWYFLTGDKGFYTYPNPFKPGSNSRHSALGGIWFKNLHAIKRRGSVNVVKIKVFNMNTHPVFESELISFKEDDPDLRPEWFWDTKNNRGSPIASGVYFYAVYNVKDKVLLKGKILIVR